MNQNKRKNLSLQDKYNIIKMIDNEVKSSEIMRKYNLKNRSNLSNIKKEREKIVALYEKKCV
jgi:hypothetical protein